MSTISASTTSTTAYKVTADTTGALVLQTGATPTTAATISSAQVVTLANALPEASGGTGTSTGYYGFKNRIINGAMVIDQRNAGASVTPNGTYVIDRWIYENSQTSKFTAQQNQNSVTPPAGFTYYSGLTSSSAYTLLAGDYFLYRQKIEGYNIADLAWGTASAATVTLSFWVRSSLTGTFGGALINGSSNRSYPFTYAISAANTWEQKSITIAGDTSGTWLTTNGIGIHVGFSLGTGSTYSGTAGAWAGALYLSATGSTSVVGTNGATFYITGVQLEKGSTATSFDYRPYGTELQLCQRYYEKSYDMASIAGSSATLNKNSLSVGAAFSQYLRWPVIYKVTKRTNTTFTIYSTTGASGNVRLNNSSDLAVSSEDGGDTCCSFYVNRSWSLGDFIWWQWTASAEL